MSHYPFPSDGRGGFELNSNAFEDVDLGYLESDTYVNCDPSNKYLFASDDSNNNNNNCDEEIFGGIESNRDYYGDKPANKSIYLSFYTPATMINIPHVPYADGSARCRILYNVMIFFINVAMSLLKYVMTKSNELTIYVTRDEKYPSYNFSHVEISTEYHTYVSKWGSTFKRIDGKLLSPDTYGSVCVNLCDEDYDVVVKECEMAANKGLKFNYIGSLCNFTVPLWLRRFMFENGVYEKEDSCFCSEFVSRALIKTKAFKHFFEEEELTPPMVSPIKLCILVSRYSEERVTNVTASTKMLKKKRSAKKTIAKK
jgi:hypothetical protein